MQARFRCATCGRGEVSAGAYPPCHGVPMECLGPLFPMGRDPEALPVALLDVYTEPVPDEAADWGERREVWFLKPGRQDGERIGWIGKGVLSWKYLMPRGISESRRQGFALSRIGVVTKMLKELDR